MTAPLAATTDPDQLLCRIAGIGDLFAIEGEFVTGKEIPSGHINTTYKATYRKSDGRKTPTSSSASTTMSSRTPEPSCAMWRKSRGTSTGKSCAA